MRERARLACSLKRYPLLMVEGKVVALHLKAGPDGLMPVNHLEAVGGKGFVGDRCFGWKIRQALLISTTDLAEFGYVPGELREQIAVDIPSLQTLPVGTRMRVGTVTLQLESDCEPCGNMARRLGEDPKAFMSKTDGRRGMLAKVLSDGEINTGDEAIVLDD